MSLHNLKWYILSVMFLGGNLLCADLHSGLESVGAQANYYGWSYSDIEKEYKEQQGWGLYMSLDVKDCDPDLIRSSEVIYQYIIQLCDLIKMKRYGEPWIHHFGEAEEVAGFTMMQPIETSLISGHFANATNAIYIDVFSCKLYDPYAVLDFTRNYFKGGDVQVNVHIRI